MSSEKNTIAITAADSWRGGSLTYWILRNIKDEFSQVRALVRKEDHAQELKRYGATLEKIDYHKPETIEKALKEVHSLILIAEDDDDNVKLAEKMIHAANKSKVECLMFISSAMVDDAKEKRIRHLKEIEEKVGKFEKRHGVLRISTPDQVFLLLSRAIQDEGKLPLSVKKDSKWAPIDLHDVGRVIQHFHESHEKIEKKKIVTITGPELLTAEKVVEKFNKATDFNIRLATVSREEMKKELEKLKHHKGSAGKTEEDEYYPHSYLITDGLIETVLDCFEAICEGKGEQKTDEYSDITGKKPVTVLKWFEENSAYFHGHGDKK